MTSETSNKVLHLLQSTKIERAFVKVASGSEKIFRTVSMFFTLSIKRNRALFHVTYLLHLGMPSGVCNGRLSLAGEHHNCTDVLYHLYQPKMNRG